MFTLIGIAFMLTALLVVLTFPVWIAGKIVARQTRALPVPFFLRRTWARWAVWYLCGIVSLTLFNLATGPLTMKSPWVALLQGFGSLLALVAAGFVTFYISWTASARRRARKEQQQVSFSEYPAPGVEGLTRPSETSTMLNGVPTLPDAHDGTDLYASPTPHEESGR